MTRLALAFLLLALFGLTACGDEEPERTAEVSAWAKVAPEQIAEAKKHGVPVAFENGLGMRFVLIPAGTFLMGSPARDKLLGKYGQHEVTLTKPIYMQTKEVTNGQFRRFKPRHRSSSPAAGGKSLDGDTQPVVRVRWTAVMTFAKWLSEQDGRRGYTLPTEAEWEYACRAGTTTRFSFGDTISSRQANFCTIGSTHYLGGPKGNDHDASLPGGRFPTNAWGLHDMHGNVREWSLDVREPYPTEAVVDPVELGRGSRKHVNRGGSWDMTTVALRSAARISMPRHNAYRSLGFRLVSPVPPTPPRWPEFPAEARPERKEGEGTVTGQMLASALDEIDSLERACTPERGTANGEVERRFGKGQAVLNQKGWPPGPPDSPNRMYRLRLAPISSRASHARLLVRYDAEWKVTGAYFLNPNILMGDLPSMREPPLRERYDEAKSRLWQMWRIRDALGRRIGK